MAKGKKKDEHAIIVAARSLIEPTDDPSKSDLPQNDSLGDSIFDVSHFISESHEPSASAPSSPSHTPPVDLVSIFENKLGRIAITPPLDSKTDEAWLTNSSSDQTNGGAYVTSTDAASTKKCEQVVVSPLEKTKKYNEARHKLDTFMKKSLSPSSVEQVTEAVQSRMSQDTEANLPFDHRRMEKEKQPLVTEQKPLSTLNPIKQSFFKRHGGKILLGVAGTMLGALAVVISIGTGAALPFLVTLAATAIINFGVSTHVGMGIALGSLIASGSIGGAILGTLAGSIIDCSRNKWQPLLDMKEPPLSAKTRPVVSQASGLNSERQSPFFAFLSSKSKQAQQSIASVCIIGRFRAQKNSNDDRAQPAQSSLRQKK